MLTGAYPRSISSFEDESMKCPTCEGKGVLKCHECNGRGWKAGILATVKCMTCDGKGMIRCANCDGKGYV